MLFKIKDLDEPLEVKEPICCKLCLQRGRLNSDCQYCINMRKAVDGLILLKLIYHKIEGIANATRTNADRSNHLFITRNKPVRESA